MNHKKSVFKTVMSLCFDIEWLGEYSEAIINLISEECDDEDDVELICHLIRNFQYYSLEQFSDLVEDLYLSIVTDPKFDENTSLIAAMSMGSDSDSGHFLLYFIKPCFAKHGMNPSILLSNLSRLREKVKKEPSIKSIFIVDEFIGSGQTVENRWKHVSNIFKDLEREVCIKFSCIASSTVGVDYLTEKEIDFDVLVSLKKGITDNHPEPIDAISRMLDLEDKLSLTYNDESMPSLGYGKTESLYARKSGNIPNSVFPFFWWPSYRNGEKRSTLFFRTM